VISTIQKDKTHAVWLLIMARLPSIIKTPHPLLLHKKTKLQVLKDRPTVPI